VPAAEAWNGTTWTVQPVPLPAGGTNGELGGVYCSSPTACISVGDYDDSANNDVPLAESWNGTSWSAQTVPNAAGATGGELFDMWCTSITACVAVGWSYTTSSGIPSLVEVWNGTAWSVQSSPNPVGSTNTELLGAWCSSPSACNAVGDYRNSSGDFVVLAEAWNGTAWSLQSAPTPVGATGPDGGNLYDVSCTSITACIAVGYYENSSDDFVAFTEQLNGTTWSILSTPLPTNTVNSFLEEVSCTSLTSCTAVGGYTASSGKWKTLVEVWNGTAWSIQSTPKNPNGATDSALIAVECAPSVPCTATGYSDNSSGTSIVLAEVRN
jgi:hypothetical protein